MKPTTFKITPQIIPFGSELSLVPLIEYWKTKLDSETPSATAFAKKILQAVENAPELLQPIRDEAILTKHQELVDMLMQAVFPKALDDEQIAAASYPFQSKVFYATERFRSLVPLEKNGSFCFTAQIDPKELIKNKLRFAYSIILRECYGVKVPEYPMMLPLKQNQETGLPQYYTSRAISKFASVVPKGKAFPQLSEAQLKELLNNFDNLDLWLEILPPEEFVFQGFVMFQLIDVTQQEAISQLKQLLLEKEVFSQPEKFAMLGYYLKVLLGIPDLKLGIASFQSSRKIFANWGAQLQNSFLLNANDGVACPYSFKTIYQTLVEENKPVIIEDLETYEELPDISDKLKRQKLRNIAIMPLHAGKQLLGMLELASSTPAQLNALSLHYLQDVFPLFSVAMERNMEVLKSRIDSLIKEECTAIHPSVEWKFVNAALAAIDKQDRGEPAAEMESIVFEDVFPLYAAVDVRSSSVKRNQAIQEDLLTQLDLIAQIIRKASKTYTLPILDELGFRVNKQIATIQEGLYSGDETNTLNFIKYEVEPMFTHFQNPSKGLAKLLKNYRQKIHPQLGFLYQRRKEFEQSLTKINELVSAYLDKAEEEAQAMFPHYFEKYKTDGIEYNIYVGQSLLEKQEYHPIHLKNLRLWQLVGICELTQKTEALKPTLQIELATTQLILVHSNPLAIRFRKDEKQFDVDGAYNIRYEIVKKRIDKSLIKETGERLTQPQKIAIVYSHPQDRDEYLEYIQYLQAKGYLTDEVEDVELEALQGVQGLRALRVGVRFKDAALKTEAVLDILENLN